MGRVQGLGSELPKMGCHRNHPPKKRGTLILEPLDWYSTGSGVRVAVGTKVAIICQVRPYCDSDGTALSNISLKLAM